MFISLETLAASRQVFRCLISMLRFSIRPALAAGVTAVGFVLAGLLLDTPARAQQAAGERPSWTSLVQQADSLLEAVSDADAPALFDRRMERVIALADSLPREATDDAFRIHLDVMAKSDARNRHRVLYESMAGLSQRYLQLSLHQTVDSLMAIYVPRHRGSMDERELGEFLSLAGYFSVRAQRFGRAVDLLQEALPLAQDRVDSAHVYTNLASSLQSLGELDRAMERYVQTLELYQADGDSARAAQVMQNMSAINLTIGRPDRALPLSQAVERWARGVGDTVKTINALTNIGLSYAGLDSVERAIESYEEGLRLAEAFGDPLLKAQLLLNFGNFYRDRSLLDAALLAYERSLSISEQEGLAIGIYFNLVNLAQLEFQEGRSEKALAYNQRAVELALSLEQPELLGRVLMQAVAVYEELGQYADALTMLRHSSEIRDEILNKQILSRIEELQIEYDTKEQEKLLEVQESMLQSLETRLNKLGIALNVFIGIALGLLVMTFVVYVYHRRRVRQMQLLYDNSIGSLLKKASKGGAERTSGEVSEKPAWLFDAVIDDRFESRQFGELYARIVRTMEEDRTFADMGLTLAHLSKRLGTNTQYVSKAINQGSGLNFNQFLNHYRIHEAKRLVLGLSELAEGKVTDTEQIMELIGFSSRSTYFQAFKTLTGMTPGQFIRFSLGQ